MTKTEYRKYIQGEGWLQRRKEFLSDCDHNYCKRCELPRWIAIIAYDQDLNIHHRNYQNLGHEADEDLEALCRRCHETETFGHSDLKAPWSKRCPHCHCMTFNPFGEEVCDACFAVLVTHDWLEAHNWGPAN